MNHRRPPLPEWWNVDRGICRWCGCCLFYQKGSKKGQPRWARWHSKCVDEYKFLFWPVVTRSKLYVIRNGKCEDCGMELNLRKKYNWKDRKYEGDTAETHHIVPLVNYPHCDSDPYAAWREGNLALLCHDCHQDRHRLLRKKEKFVIQDNQMSLGIEYAEIKKDQLG